MHLNKYRVLAMVALAFVLASCMSDLPQQVLNVAPSPEPVATPAPHARIPVKIGELRDIPVTKSDSMRQALRRLAENQGFEAVSDPDKAFTYTVQGQFSTLASNGAATIIQRWSIYDASGKLAHEFILTTPQSGNESFPWTAVSKATIDNMANAALSQISAWHRRARFSLLR